MAHYRQGRLIDHVHFRARDTRRTFAFYEATLAALGIECTITDTYLSADELWIDGGSGTHVHLAFQAPSRAHVDAWYAAGLAAGGTDNGAPGARDYFAGYYAAFLLDPDGNNVEAVHPGETRRSAEAIEVARPAA